VPNIIKKVQNTCFQNDLFKKEDKIILAVSGGPDSMAMLDIFAKLKPKYDLELAIAHVNYGLRGRDGEKDEMFVKDLAKKYDLPVFVLDAKSKAGKDKSEDALRKIRYEFFERLRKEKNFTLVSVAHNADDQVETYLMRVIRGAGLLGLSAMRPKSGKIIRPLLDITRAEIVAYLREKKLKYRTDKTNLESKYLRNKIRNKLIPTLCKNFNPEIRKTILKSVRSIQDDYDYIDAKARTIYKKNAHLSAKDVLKLHPALSRRVLLLAIENARGSLKNIDSSHVSEIIKTLKSTKNKRQVVIFKGLKMTRNGDNISLEKSDNK